MSESIQAMRERRNALAKETRNLLDKNTNAEWNDDLQAKYDGNMAEIECIDAAIQRHQRLADLEAEQMFKAAGGAESDGGAEQLPTAARAAFNKLIRHGERALNAEDWQALNAGGPQNTMSTTTDSEGGYTVQTDVATSILDALKAYGGMRQVATVIQTAKGNPFDYPTSDGTAEEGEIIAENGSATDADIAFGVKSIGSYKFSSKVVTVPIELLQDSSIDVEALIRQRFVDRLGRITNKMFTIGTGTAQPEGIVTASAAGRAGAVSATPAITYLDLLELEHSVDPAYRQNAGVRWMMHDSALKLVRTIVDSEGRPLFVPSFDLRLGGAPAELMGYPIQINQHVAVPAASAKSVLFGDFSKYLIRDVMAMTLFRFTDSVYAKKGQVGFLAWMRADGKLVDVGGAVKHFVHGAAA